MTRRRSTAPLLPMVICLIVATLSCEESSPEPRSEPGAEVEFSGDLGGAKPRATIDPTVAHPHPDLTPLTPVYKVTADGQPPGEVTVRLPVTAPHEAETIPLVLSAPSPDGPWEPIVTEPSLINGKVQATTTRFSWFTALLVPVRALLDEAKRVFDDATGGFVAEAEQPSCSGEREARERVTITSSSGTTIKWCLGKEGNDIVLRVVNGRRYPLEVSRTGLEVSEDQAKYKGFASLARLGSGETTQLLPGEPVGFRLTGARARLQTEFGGAAFGLYQLQIGIETGLAFLTRFGIGSNTKAIDVADKVLRSGKCASTVFSPTGGSIIGNCLGPKDILEAFGAKAVFLAPLLVVGPVIAYFESAFSGLADVATSRDRYSIVIGPATRPTTTPPPRTTDIFDGPLSCQKILAAISSMPPADQDKIGILVSTFVRVDPTQARALQFVGVPRDSGSGDAYDYRWTSSDGLRFNGPLSDYSIPERSPFVVRRAASGEFTCEAR